MEFIQIIEFSTTRFEEVEALMNQWVTKTEGKRKARRGTLTADRDKPDTYLQIIEFPSYDEAMANSNLPETNEIAEKMEELCDGPAMFRNLDVRRVDELS
jgi:hypothetical protein